MLSKAAAQLALHGSEENHLKLFDSVIFCANVTYADGGFKGGQFWLLFLIIYALWGD